MVDKKNREDIVEEEDEEDEEDDFELIDDENDDFKLIDDDEDLEDLENNEVNKDSNSFDEKKRIFIPTIQGSDVIELKINGSVLPLKTKISFEIFSQKLMPILFELQKFIELENFTSKTKAKRKGLSIFSEPWDDDSFFSFWSGLNEKQKEFVKIVYENEEISRENLIKDLIKEKILIKDDPKLKNNLAGLSAGLTRKWNNLQLEPLWIIKNDKYIMNQKPLKILTEFFDNLGN